MRRVANVALGLALLMTGCEEPSAPGGTIAQVGDIALTEADLEAKLPLGVDPENVDGERARLIDAWVQQELLYQEALRRDLHRQARLQTLLERARRDLLIAALLDAEFAGRETAIDEEAIAAYYRERAGDFQRPLPEIRARHILLASQRDANAKRRLLQQNTPFEQVAADHSIDPDTRFQSGDLGYFSEDLDPILWEACQDLSLNKVSKPIRTEYGYHLVEVLDRQEVGTLRDLAQVRQQVVEGLVRQRHQEQLDRLIGQLKVAHSWSIAAAVGDSM
jgi:peptidyl-prolyl cis-trans isomerase C